MWNRNTFKLLNKVEYVAKRDDVVYSCRRLLDSGRLAGVPSGIPLRIIRVLAVVH
jgi:hypothetical protein